MQSALISRCYFIISFELCKLYSVFQLDITNAMAEMTLKENLVGVVSEFFNDHRGLVFVTVVASYLWHPGNPERLGGRFCSQSWSPSHLAYAGHTSMVFGDVITNVCHLQ